MSRLEKAIQKAVKSRQIEPLSEGKPELVKESHPGDRLLQVEPLNAPNPLLLINQEKTSYIIEEYKKLKSVIVQMTDKEKFLNTLMFTSTMSGEGKTLTVLNLAISLAQELDHTVLVVDADLRQPSVHEYLGLKPQAGLVECLTQDVPLEDVLVKTGIGKLVILPAGSPVANPAELLSSKRMKEMVQELKKRYPDRYVLFDTTPVLSFAESFSLASFMDGIVFIVREGRAKSHQVKMALDSLKKNNNILGVVYNDSHFVSKKDNDYYSYY